MTTDPLSTRAARLLEAADLFQNNGWHSQLDREVWRSLVQLLRASAAELTAAERELERVKYDAAYSNTVLLQQREALQGLLAAAEAERDRLEAEAEIPMELLREAMKQKRQAESELTATREALRQLVEKWRQSADGTEYSDYGAGKEYVFIECANKLEAALGPSAVQTPEKL